ncbi:hypothetical protein LV779_12605 [Streptomyces thinghirensis]|nr:hypothetical protein [Streptomyces thinghirensis]
MLEALPTEPPGALVAVRRGHRHRRATTRGPPMAPSLRTAAWPGSRPIPRGTPRGRLRGPLLRGGGGGLLTTRLRSWDPVFGLERTTGEHRLFLGVAARDLPLPRQTS